MCGVPSKVGWYPYPQILDQADKSCRTNAVIYFACMRVNNKNIHLQSPSIAGLSPYPQILDQADKSCHKNAVIYFACSLVTNKNVL